MREYTMIPFIEACLDNNDEASGNYICPLHPTEIIFTINHNTKWHDIGRCCVGRGDSMDGVRGCTSSGGYHEIIRKEYCKAGDHYVLLVFGSYGG